MDFSLNKFNSPKKKIIIQQDKPQLNHFIPKISSDNQFKQKILIQNKALARKNSILMTKISDLETKISDLIQQNIELRAVNAKSDDQKRKWLEDKLNLIEESVNQRFSEINQIFKTIRENEGLDKSVSFKDLKSPRKASKSERKRKSLRRQSIYIPPPDSPTIYEQSISQFDKNVENFNQEAIPIHFDNNNPFQDSYDNIEDIIQLEQAEAFEKLTELEQQHEHNNNTNNEDNDSSELTEASNLSPIKLSSPEEKFQVFKDDSISNKIDKIVSGSTLNKFDQELADIQKPLIHDINKIKHTKREKTKFVIDDSMPGSNVDDDSNRRRSRARSKPISYAEPSLRAKMRRQSEKFVGAADEEAYDAYINNVLINRRKTITKEEDTNKENELIEVHKTNHTDDELKKNILDSRESPIKKSLIELDNINITKRRKPLSNVNSNKISKKNNNAKHKLNQDDDESDMSVFDLVEESSVGVPKTYKGKPEIKLKRRNSRRHSMIL